ncbi:TPA: hypothetical protein ACSTJX_000332 [Serratia fonticola]
MKLFSFGAVITVVYFFALCFVIVNLNLAHFTSWNELGDFLAGAFSPVAFLWLVLGYLQQQKELQQNTKALELQALELKNSVDQYKSMVEVARDQLNYDREFLIREEARKEKEVKPDVNLVRVTWIAKANNDDYVYEITFSNDAYEARNVEVFISPAFGDKQSFSYKSIKEDNIKLPVIYAKRNMMPEKTSLIIKYESILGWRYEKEYILTINSKAAYDFELCRDDDTQNGH